MSKPINVEAQRVTKVIEESFENLRILAMLNQEFFEDLRKKVGADEGEITSHFGNRAGKLLIKHAILEERFITLCVEDGMKMTPIEELTDEGQQCAKELEQTTKKLVRQFKDRELQLKLKAQGYGKESSEFNGFLNSFTNLQKLFITKLNTPVEEVNSIRENLKQLQIKTSKLKDQKVTKRDAFEKYREECSKSKEIRDSTIKILKEQVSTVSSEREQKVDDSVKEGLQKEEELNKSHANVCTTLKKDIEKLTKELQQIKTKNKNDEENIRKEYKKATNSYNDTMGTYDTDLMKETKDNKKCQEEYDDSAAELQQAMEEYHMRKDERKKREEMDAMMKKRKDEQNEQMQKLERASAFMQAHWRGLLARREMEKARKGKKKKKKKK